MLICHCRQVTDRQIRAAARAAHDAMDAVRRCGAGSRCGGCWPALEQLLREYGLDETLARRDHSAA